MAFVASVLGLVFASYSTLDYASHLDRQLHDLHCSIIPGAAPTDAADACRAAMYSPYSAVLKEKYWGGLPISLFALGAFSFFAAFALYVLLANRRVPNKAVGFFALAGTTPLLVSVVMATISATKLGSFCKTCVGIYISSTLLAIGVWLTYAARGKGAPAGQPSPGTPYDAQVATAPGSDTGWAAPLAWLVVLGIFALAPAVVYAASVPDHRPYLTECGTLKHPEDTQKVLIEIASPRSTKPVTTFEDPLCPTCKGFHERLVGEGIYDNLAIRLALFPLDSECNWMLDEPLHPGACIVSKAVICGAGQNRARDVLEWAYDEQDALGEAGRTSEDALRALIKQKWGATMLQCIDAPKTKQTLNRHLHFAVDNNVPVSTPQMYLDNKQRICDEDTDIGLRFTMNSLAPEVLR